MGSENIVLNIGDYVLRGRDIELLKAPHWLNDNLIGFYLQHLQQGLPPDNHDTILFVEPSVTQLLKELDGGDNAVRETLPEIAEAMKTKEFIFFVVNDATQTEGLGGGSHWSLLVFSKMDRHFVHFDSSNKFNDEDAKIIAKKLSPFCASATPFINHQMCNKQSNGHDCGCHVLRNVEMIAEYVMNFGEGTKGSILSVQCPTATPEDAQGMRDKLKKTIEKLAKQS